MGTARIEGPATPLDVKFLHDDSGDKIVESPVGAMETIAEEADGWREAVDGGVIPEHTCDTKQGRVLEL